jgi:hypothetical protein
MCCHNLDSGDASTKAKTTKQPILLDRLLTNYNGKTPTANYSNEAFQTGSYTFFLTGLRILMAHLSWLPARKP